MADPTDTRYLHAATRRRVGVLDSGALAAVSDSGWIHTLDDTIRVTWWVGAEDRWHRPDVERSARTYARAEAPMVETVVRVPGGKVVGTAYGAMVGSESQPGVVLDVHNDSPVPLAVGLVVETDLEMTVSAGGVRVGDRMVLAATRPAGRFAVAPDVDSLFERVAGEELGEDPPAGVVRGAVVMVIPVPHAAHGVAVVDGADGSADRQLIPSPERVAAGWAALDERAVQLDLIDGRFATALRAAMFDVRLGPDADDVEGVCRVAAARARIGDPDGGRPEVAAVARLARGDGRIGGRPDAIGRTVAFVDAVVAAASAGLALDALEESDELIASVAGAAHWLCGSRRRFADDEQRAAAHRVAGMVPHLLWVAGQPEAATHLTRVVAATEGRVGQRTPTWRSAAAVMGELGGWAGPDGMPSPHRNASVIDTVFRGVVEVSSSDAPDSVALDVFAGWSSQDRGRAVEVHRVPTMAGEVSLALRWHETRPAVLWECRPWPDRPPFRLSWTARRFDAGWVGEGLSGEALLAEPPDDDV